MNNLIKQYSKMSILISIIMIIVGAILVFKPVESALTIITVLGICLLILGGIQLIRFFSNGVTYQYYSLDFLQGIAEVVLSLIFIIKPDIIASFFSIILGFILVIQGAIKFQYMLQLKTNGGNQWKILLCISLVTLVAGVIIIFTKFTATATIAILTGAALIAEGVIGIIEYVSLIDVANQLEDFMKK